MPTLLSRANPGVSLTSGALIAPGGPFGPVGKLGPIGPTGEKGPDLQWQGVWSATVNYQPDEAVSHIGSTYFCLAENTGLDPALDDGSHWQLMAEGGPGVSGIPGARGDPGPNAFSVLNGPFTIPPIGSTVIVTLDDASWVGVGQDIYVGEAGGPGEAGSMQVVAKNGNQLTLRTPAQPADGFVLADGYRDGLLARVSGRRDDFVDGTNSCRPLPLVRSLRFLSGPTNLDLADNGHCLFCTGGAWTLGLPAPQIGLTYSVRNEMGLVAPSGSITLAPASGTIDGAATRLLLPQQDCQLVTDGVNWRTVGLQRKVVIGTREITSPTGSTSILLPEGYTEFELLFRNINSSGSGENLQCRVSTNGGATWAATTYYGMYHYTHAASAMTTNQQNNIAMWYLTHFIENYPRHKLIMRLSPGAADAIPMFLARSTMYYQAGGFAAQFESGGFYSVFTRINALQLWMSGGNIQRMSLTVKGIV